MPPLLKRRISRRPHALVKRRLVNETTFEIVNARAFPLDKRYVESATYPQPQPLACGRKDSPRGQVIHRLARHTRHSSRSAGGYRAARAPARLMRRVRGLVHPGTSAGVTAGEFKSPTTPARPARSSADATALVPMSGAPPDAPGCHSPCSTPSHIPDAPRPPRSSSHREHVWR